MSGRRSIYVIALALAVTALLVTSLGTRASVAPGSRKTLASTFDSDMRHVVYEWDPNDPTPQAERRKALFDFTYETYETSAWIPQSLFDGNLVTQAVVGDIDTIVGEKVGLVRWRDNELVPAFGMAPNVAAHGGDRKTPLRWTVNCLVCHTAEIDGVAYFGAGTKLFDEVWLGEALKRLTGDQWLARLARNPVDSALAANANRILNSHHHDKIDSLTRARSTAFAASHVELYMRPHNGAMPAIDEVGRGDVKTPPLWHTAAKMPAGRWYTDGSFHGPIPLMASSMELEKDRSFDALVDVVVPKIKEEFDSVIRHLRPPRYPYADRSGAGGARARAVLLAGGRMLSVSRACTTAGATCSGPACMPTSARIGRGLDVVSDGFIDAFNRSPLATEGALMKSRGYAATPLTGVWANFPYLHNGSVPTLHHLLGPASERPKIFQVTAARRFDRVRVGQPLYENPTRGAACRGGARSPVRRRSKLVQ